LILMTLLKIMTSKILRMMKRLIQIYMVRKAKRMKMMKKSMIGLQKILMRIWLKEMVKHQMIIPMKKLSRLTKKTKNDYYEPNHALINH